MSSVSKVMEQQELSYSFDRSINWYNHFENQYNINSVEDVHTLLSINSTLRNFSSRNVCAFSPGRHTRESAQ